MRVSRSGPVSSIAAGTAVVSDAPSGLKLTALATGFVMAALDVTIVNVAGSAIQDGLHASLAELTWIVDGYVLVFSALLMLAGALANRIGAKTVYQSGMVVFFIGSLGCALAPGSTILIVARLVQGAGAALFMPSSLSLLVYSFPDRRQRTHMLGLWSAIVATSAGLGPTIGGLLVAFGWPSIFLLNLPIGVVGILLTHRYIDPREGVSSTLALPGHLLWIVTLATLSYVLVEGPRLGWSATGITTGFAILVVSSALLVFRESRTANSIMPWRLFRIPRFAGANLVGFLFNFALYGSMFMLSLFFQNGRGATAWQAGLELLPMTIWFPIGNLVYSRVSARYPNGRLLAVFLLIAGSASFVMCTVSSTTPYWCIAAAVSVANIGAGIISPGMTAVLVDAAGRDNANVAGAVLNANRQIGTLVGVAVMGLILASVSSWDVGPAASFGVIGGAYLAAAVGAWRLILVPERLDPVPAAR